MPTNRKRLSRKVVEQTLTPKLRAFFETGAIGTETEEDGDIFIMANSYRAITAAYEPHRDEILKQWKRPGLPWAEEVRDANK